MIYLTINKINDFDLHDSKPISKGEIVYHNEENYTGPIPFVKTLDGRIGCARIGSDMIEIPEEIKDWPVEEIKLYLAL